MRDVTLCYLVDNENVLLAMKKRGFGVGKWNGFGGKVEPGESIEDAMIREAFEETSVKLDKSNLSKVAVIDFFFPHKPEWDQKVHVFTAKKWNGYPAESEEMRPEWFPIKNFPIDKMWPDDPHWLPHILDGKKVRASFVFGKADDILSQDVKLVEYLE